MKILSLVLGIILAVVVVILGIQQLINLYSIGTILLDEGFVPRIAPVLGSWLHNIIYIIVLSIFTQIFLDLGKD